MHHFIKWLAAITGLIASIIAAIGIANLMLPAFCMWAFSSVLWVWQAWKIKNSSFLFTQCGYLIIDLIGVWRWWYHIRNF